MPILNFRPAPTGRPRPPSLGATPAANEPINRGLLSLGRSAVAAGREVEQNIEQEIRDKELQTSQRLRKQEKVRNSQLALIYQDAKNDTGILISAIEQDMAQRPAGMVGSMEELEKLFMEGRAEIIKNNSLGDEDAATKIGLNYDGQTIQPRKRLHTLFFEKEQVKGLGNLNAEISASILRTADPALDSLDRQVERQIILESLEDAWQAGWQEEEESALMYREYLRDSDEARGANLEIEDPAFVLKMLEEEPDAFLQFGSATYKIRLKDKASASVKTQLREDGLITREELRLEKEIEKERLNQNEADWFAGLLSEDLTAKDWEDRQQRKGTEFGGLSGDEQLSAAGEKRITKYLLGRKNIKREAGVEDDPAILLKIQKMFNVEQDATAEINEAFSNGKIKDTTYRTFSNNNRNIQKTKQREIRASDARKEQERVDEAEARETRAAEDLEDLQDTTMNNLYTEWAVGILDRQRIIANRHNLDKEDYQELLDKVRDSRPPAKRDDPDTIFALWDAVWDPNANRVAVRKDILRELRKGNIVQDTSKAMLTKNQSLIEIPEGPKTLYDRRRSQLRGVLAEKNQFGFMNQDIRTRLESGTFEFDQTFLDLGLGPNDPRINDLFDDTIRRWQNAGKNAYAVLARPRFFRAEIETGVPDIEAMYRALEEAIDEGDIGPDAAEREKDLLLEWFDVRETLNSLPKVGE